METRGARLKKIRLEKGITLEEAYKKTKIHLNILKAIEEDSLINFNPVYIKGFLKIYCKFLGVDPREYITDMQEQKEVVSPIKIASEGPALKLRQGVSSYLAFLKKLPLECIARTVLAALVIIVSVVIIYRLGKFISSKHIFVSRKKATVVTTSSTAKAEKKTSKAQQPATATVQSTETHTESIPKSSTSGIRLTILAKDNCWISLKVDGKVVFQGVLAKGRSNNWQAKERMELSLGNAGAVDLEVNGKLISNLGKKGQALKNILITKEGLSTQR